MALARSATPPRPSSTTAARGEAGRSSGLGEGVAVTVKNEKADSQQRATIDGALAEARSLRASSRVMVGIVMAMTVESECRPVRHGDEAGPDSRGPFQQRATWGPEADRLDPAASTRLFLTANKGHGVQGWKVVNGGLSTAPGGLGASIERVQNGPAASVYAQWQPEAERTVAAWTGSDGLGFSVPGASGRYEFTRGQRGGEREDSWEASGRLAEEVRWGRWAAGNVLYFVSDEELRQAAPSLTIRGDEAFLLTGPIWDWSTARVLNELTLNVLSERWGVMPGACVVLAMGGPYDGRWIVKSVAGERLDSPECAVVLRRPVMQALEPAAQSETDASSSTDGAANPVLESSQAISAEERSYLYGGGHGPPLSSIGPNDELDCSSSCSLALSRAGHFPGNVAIVSGAFASSWGVAGKGRIYTVWANGEHVWIEFHGAPGVVRFDTSPHGDGPSGPRVRSTARNDQGRFTARHWEGF